MTSWKLCRISILCITSTNTTISKFYLLGYFLTGPKRGYLFITFYKGEVFSYNICKSVSCILSYFCQLFSWLMINIMLTYIKIPSIGGDYMCMHRLLMILEFQGLTSITFSTKPANRSPLRYSIIGRARQVLL